MKNGDTITIDTEEREMTVDISAAELKETQEGVEETRTLLPTRRAGEIHSARHQRLARRGDGCRI